MQNLDPSPNTTLATKAGIIAQERSERLFEVLSPWNSIATPIKSHQHDHELNKNNSNRHATADGCKLKSPQRTPTQRTKGN